MKQLTLKLLALVMALAMPGGMCAAVAEPVILEDAPDEAFALPGAQFDVDLPGLGDFELANNDIVGEDVVTENDAPAMSNEIVKSGSCGPNITWTLDDSGLLTLSGSGDMDNYFAFWEINGGVGIKRAVVEEGVTSLALNTFNGCDELESVSLPDTLENILGSAFSDCGSLTRVDSPYGVPWISGYCFAGCY
ncbi:MAG: leucine-rich repeat protein, partial [Clostridia bacterium]|nr:leucine-rich repeat protein [Clostridia bacterium]